MAQRAEDLHQMRVEVKKLSAMLRFLKHEVPGYKLKQSTRFIRNTFKLSGEIRDAANTLQLARKFQVTYLATSDKESAFRKLKKRYVGIAKLHKAEKYAAKLIRKVRVKHLESYVLKELGEIGAIIALRPGKDSLHKLRKRLKDICYLHKELQKYAKGLPRLTAINLDKLQDAIGKWHDLDLFAQQLQAVNPKPLAPLKQVAIVEKKLLAQITKLSGVILQAKSL